MDEIVGLFYLGAIASFIAGVAILFRSGFTFEGTITFAVLFVVSITFILFSIIAELYTKVEKLECERIECERPGEHKT